MIRFANIYTLLNKYGSLKSSFLKGRLDSRDGDLFHFYTILKQKDNMDAINVNQISNAKEAIWEDLKDKSMKASKE